jgi:hypothetical protein
MDGSRFDNLTRTLATSRRGLFKHLASGLLAGAGGLLGAGVAEVQACAAVKKKCAADGDCCFGLCDPASGGCVCPGGTEECRGDCIPLDQYQSAIDNCGACRVRCKRAPECQVAACIDGVCGTAPDPTQLEQPCGPFHGIYGVCLADGTCACPSHLPTQCPCGCVDTTSDAKNCGARDNLCGGQCCPGSRNCCDGVCCPSGQCCADGICSFEACAPHCVIDGRWIADGTVNPDNDCEICDRDRDESNWSTTPSGTACDEPGQCCNLGLCATCGGRINEHDIATGAFNPANACEVCDPVQDPFAWSPLSDESCGEHHVCCFVGTCCGFSGVCEPMLPDVNNCVNWQFR